MAHAPEPPPALVRAAQELEDELRRCEEAVVDAAKARLNTEKSIGRAARALKTAGEHRDRMGAKIKELLAAIQAAGVRAEAAATAMEARAGDIQARLERLNALQARASEIAVAVRDVTEFARQAKSPGEILERLGPVEEGVARAQEAAKADDFDDLAHDLAGLREMLASMRRKLEGK